MHIDIPSILDLIYIAASVVAVVFAKRAPSPGQTRLDRAEKALLIAAQTLDFNPEADFETEAVRIARQFAPGVPEATVRDEVKLASEKLGAVIKAAIEAKIDTPAPTPAQLPQPVLPTPAPVPDTVPIATPAVSP